MTGDYKKTLKDLYNLKIEIQDKEIVRDSLRDKIALDRKHLYKLSMELTELNGKWKKMI